MSVCSLVSRACRSWAVLVVIAALVASGCQPSGYSGPTGTVSGKVTFGGEVVPQGCTVSFVSDEGYTARGQVGGERNTQNPCACQDACSIIQPHLIGLTIGVI